MVLIFASCEEGVDPDDDQIGPVDIEEVLIPVGTFSMGSSDTTEDAAEANRMALREGPKRNVTFTNSFCMGIYLVTQAQYRAVMGINPSIFQGANLSKWPDVNADNLPVENVSWYNAVEFCNRLSSAKGLFPAYTIDKNTKDPDNTNNAPQDPRWTVIVNIKASGYRLPTEAEWEYACRAGKSTPFSLTDKDGKDVDGNDISTEQANFDGTPYIQTKPSGTPLRRTSEVGSYPPNKWGIYDMHGNVYEWCWDRMANDALPDEYDNYYATSYNPENLTDPLGLPRADRRVERGGSFNHPAFRVRSAWRERAQGWRAGPDLGFRVVRTIVTEDS
jgi:formylglycine-generating enzyme required for sulfatase activity